MKVLLVTGIFPPDHGGPASYVPAVAGGLKDCGHEIVAVITLSDSLTHDDSRWGFPVVRILRNRYRPLRWLHAATAIYRLAKASDVVYLNGLVLEGILAVKVLGSKPAVIKVVGDLIWEKARNADATRLEIEAFQHENLPWRWQWLRRLQGWYTAQADAVITPSQYLSGIVAGWGVDGDRIYTVYNAITTSPERATNVPHPRFDLVTVARLVPWKGIASLIRVAAGHGWSLRIVGDGPMRGELEAYAQQSGGANISFAGHVPHAQVSDEIRNARLFVLNSTYEGLPHIVLEAKAAGVTVLASDAGGTPETIRHGENGWLVPVGDDTALADGIRYLLGDDAARLRLAEAGRRQVADNFSYNVMVEATEAILAGAFR